MRADRQNYGRADVMAMDRVALLDFFKREGPPDGVLQRHLQDAATETLRRICLSKLEAEGRVKG